MSREPFVYAPSVFDRESIEEAKRIILTAPSAEQTERHWREDTPPVVDFLIRHLEPRPDHRLLDFGCGIGRLAKPIIERTGCSIVGADISASMRALALTYTGSERFSTVPPDTLPGPTGAIFDGAYAVLVIQHCPWPGEELQRIRDCLRPGGRFVLINTVDRFVPTESGWINDGIDVFALASEIFPLKERMDVPVGSNETVATGHYAAVFTKPPA